MPPAPARRAAPRPGAPRSRQGSPPPLACPQHHVGRPGRELGAGGGQVSGGAPSCGGLEGERRGQRSLRLLTPRVSAAGRARGPGARRRECECDLPTRGKRHRRAGTAARDIFPAERVCRLRSCSSASSFQQLEMAKGAGKKRPIRSQVFLSHFALFFSSGPKNIPANYSPVLPVLTHGSKAAPGLRCRLDHGALREWILAD